MVSPTVSRASIGAPLGVNASCHSINPIHFLKKVPQAALPSLNSHAVAWDSSSNISFFAKVKRFICEICKKIKRIWESFVHSLIGYICPARNNLSVPKKEIHAAPSSVESSISPIDRAKYQPLEPNQSEFSTSALSDTLLREETILEPAQMLPVEEESVILTSSQQAVEEYEQASSLADSDMTELVSFMDLQEAKKAVEDMDAPSISRLVDELVVLYALRRASQNYFPSLCVVFTVAMIATLALAKITKKTLSQHIHKAVLLNKKPVEPPVDASVESEELQLVTIDSSQESEDNALLSDLDCSESLFNVEETAVRTHHLVGQISLGGFVCLALSSFVDGTVTLEGIFPDDVQKTSYQNVYLIKYQSGEKYDYGNRRFAYLNGSGNSFYEAISNARLIAKTAQTDVILGYIPTVTVIHDLFGALLERYEHAQAPISHAEVCRNTCLAGTSGNHELVLMPHSRGMHSVIAAHRHYGDKITAIFKRTRLYAIAGSGHIAEPHHFKDVVNTVCLSDYLIRYFDNDSINRQRASKILREVDLHGDNKAFYCSGHTFVSPTTQKTISHYVSLIRDEHEKNSEKKVL